MSQSSGATRPDDPLTEPLADYRDPLAPTTDAYATSGATAVGSTDYASTEYASTDYAADRSSGSGGTADTAKQQAGRVGDEAKQSGAHVAGVAKEQAAGVAEEAKNQAKGVLGQGRAEVRSQVAQQKQRATGGIRSVGEQLNGLASGSPQPGVATDLAQQASQQVAKVAEWLESREPADLLADVQRFARRRPGVFLAVAAGVGVVAGRLTRGVAAEVSDEKQAQQHASGAVTGASTGQYAGDPYASDPYAGGQYAGGLDAGGQDAGEAYASDPYATPAPYAEADPYAAGGTSSSRPSTAGDLGYSTGTGRTAP